MKAVRGSGSWSQSINAERSRGDQSEGNLAKHYRSPVNCRDLRSGADAPSRNDGVSGLLRGFAPRNDEESRACALSKLRRTLFRERLDAFLDLGAAHAVAMSAVGSLFIQNAAGEFVDRALHAAHRDRRVAGDNACGPIHLLV